MLPNAHSITFFPEEKYLPGARLDNARDSQYDTLDLVKTPPKSKNGSEAGAASPSLSRGTVRRFSLSDAAAVKSLIQGVLAREYPDDQPAYPAADLERIGVAYGGTREAFLVAEASGKLVGTCAVKDEGQGVALLRRLFVHSNHRREGIGSLLLDAAVAHCQELGFKQIKIRTSDRMREAVSLCRAKGFEEDERFQLGSVQLICMTLRI